MTGIAGLTAAAAPATNPLPPLNQAPRQGQILPKCYNGSADCGLLIMNLLQRTVAKARHPFDRWERFYVFPDQWGMTKPQEQHRFEECNKIIESLGTFKTIVEIGSAEGYQTEWLSALGEVHGIEPSYKAIKRAQQRISDATFEQGVFPDCPVRKADLVCAFEVLYYLSDVRKAIEWLSASAPVRIISYHLVEKNANRIEPFLPSCQKQIIAYGHEMWVVAHW